MTEPKTSRAGCSCTRVTAAIRPCLVLEAERPSAKGLPSLLEKHQSPRHESQAVLEEGLKALALQAPEQSPLSQVTLERTGLLNIHQNSGLGTSIFNHERAQQLLSTRQKTFRCIKRGGMESASIASQGVQATIMIWKSVSKVEGDMVERWR